MLLHIILTLLIIQTYGNSYRIQRLLPDHRIVGGQRVDIRSHPHQLSLQTLRHICGASIIGENWAITAGHCVGGSPLSYKLRAGNSNNRNGTVYKVANIVRHPLFNRFQIDYDVAVIQLAGTFKFGPTVQPINLADKQLQSGQIVNITGWGNTEIGANDGFLRQVSVPIVEHELCEKAYRDINPITPRMICAGLLQEGGKDSCQGDSGGPLTANGTLYGLVSWGLGCAQPRFPGVYTNVAELRSWIKNTTGI